MSIPKIRETHPETGKAICGAKTRHVNRFGEFYCLQDKLLPSGRCKLHSGGAKPGVAHHNFKHGRYIKRDQNVSALGALVLKHLEGDDYQALRDEIALLRARLSQLFEHADAAPDRAVSVDLVRKAYDNLLRAMDKGEADGLVSARSFLAAALNKLNAEQEAWNEIRATTTALQRLVSNETAREKINNEFLHVRDLTLLFANLQRVILDTVTDVTQRKAIQEGFRMALLEHRLLTARGDE